jgi:hypothetical protein
VGRDDISFLKETFSTKFGGSKIIPTTETGIKSIIYSLNKKSHQVMME